MNRSTTTDDILRALEEHGGADAFRALDAEIKLNDDITADEVAAALLTAAGYRRVSRQYGMVARIDRADWADVLAGKRHARRTDWSAEDSYRRIHSKDSIELPRGVALRIPSSSGTTECTGYVAWWDELRKKVRP